MPPPLRRDRRGRDHRGAAPLCFLHPCCLSVPHARIPRRLAPRAPSSGRPLCPLAADFLEYGVRVRSLPAVFRGHTPTCPLELNHVASRLLDTSWSCGVGKACPSRSPAPRPQAQVPSRHAPCTLTPHCVPTTPPFQRQRECPPHLQPALSGSSIVPVLRPKRLGSPLTPLFVSPPTSNPSGNPGVLPSKPVQNHTLLPSPCLPQVQPITVALVPGLQFSLSPPACPPRSSHQRARVGT